VKKETANPMPITSLNNYVITQVAAGEKHSVVLASDGSVLTFGSGSNGTHTHTLAPLCVCVCGVR
jgi:alpha-tubulin suppressor-like RCC1 family protein